MLGFSLSCAARLELLYSTKPLFQICASSAIYTVTSTILLSIILEAIYMYIVAGEPAVQASLGHYPDLIQNVF